MSNLEKIEKHFDIIVSEVFEELFFKDLNSTKKEFEKD